jgi:hypothetical protein
MTCETVPVVHVNLLPGSIDAGACESRWCQMQRHAHQTSHNCLYPTIINTLMMQYC